VSGYIWFSPFHHLLLRATVHARFIQLLNCMIVVFPLLLVHFSTVYTTRIHSLGALQHYNTWIYLEFCKYIGTCCLDCQQINGYFIWLSGFMDLLHITWMVNKGLQVLLCLSLHDCDCTCMLCIVINMWFSKFPWVIHTVYIEKHPPLTCIQIVYTGFSPLTK